MKMNTKIPESLLEMESLGLILKGHKFDPLVNASATELNGSSRITGRWQAKLCSSKIKKAGGDGLQDALNGMVAEASKMINAKPRAPSFLGRTPGVTSQVCVFFCFDGI